MLTAPRQENRGTQDARKMQEGYGTLASNSRNVRTCTCNSSGILASDEFTRQVLHCQPDLTRLRNIGSQFL